MDNSLWVAYKFTTFDDKRLVYADTEFQNVINYLPSDWKLYNYENDKIVFKNAEDTKLVVTRINVELNQ